MSCRFLHFRKRRSQTAAKMTTCHHSIELIGYQSQVHWQNNCTVLITKDQSSNGCEHVSIFLLVIFYLICQVRAAKNTRCDCLEDHRRALVSQHLRNVQAKFHRNLPNFYTLLRRLTTVLFDLGVYLLKSKFQDQDHWFPSFSCHHSNGNGQPLILNNVEYLENYSDTL